MSRADDNPLAGRIFTIRGLRVILDADLARLYGVATKRFNEAVKRNAQRFPSDFAFQLNAKEDAALRKQLAASIVESAGNREPAPMWSQIATTSKPQRCRLTNRPWAFTEHGAVMAANVLRSAKAVEMSVYVVRAFVRMREELMSSSEILKRLAHIDRSLIEHDTALQILWHGCSRFWHRRPRRLSRGSGFARPATDDRPSVRGSRSSVRDWRTARSHGTSRA